MIGTYGSFGSDGAALMVGRENGVAAKLSKEQKSLVNIHCVAHRLALAFSEIAETVPDVKRLKGMLKVFVLSFIDLPIALHI